MFSLILLLQLIIITSLPLLTKPTNNNSCTLNFKSECPSRYEKAIINNLISRAKLTSPPKQHFIKKLKKDIKQTLIDNGFPNYIVDKQIKRMIKNVSQNNKHSNTPPYKQEFIKHFLPQPLDEHIL